MNAVSIYASEGQYYCKCHLFPGCENYVGHRGYCVVCRIRDMYCSHDFEEIKYDPVKLSYSELLEFDNRLNFWWEEFEYKWRDISLGVMGGIYIKDCDYF